MKEESDDLLRVAASFVLPIREALLTVVRNFLSSVSENQIVGILQKEGYFSKAYDNIDDLLDLLGEYLSDDVIPLITDAWLASGRKTSSVLPKGALIGAFSFDTRRVAALGANEGYRAQLVVDLREAQRLTITQVINRGIIEGRSRAQVARDIRASIGLTDKQEQWVENYRRQLSEMDSAALDRLLRDKRSDRLLRRLFDSGELLTTAQITSLVERYRQRIIKMRAGTIARTEALRAMRMGEYDAISAANEARVLNPLLKRFWVTSMDERVRKYHISIPGMNPDGRSIEEPFQTPLGPLMYPLDPMGSARNVINCRCRLIYRVPTASGQYKNVPVRGHMPADVASILDESGE
jgi:hypothetical protein